MTRCKTQDLAQGKERNEAARVILCKKRSFEDSELVRVVAVDVVIQ